MPTYEYQTNPTDGSEPKTFEVVQSMKDEPLKVHPETGEPVRRIISGGFGVVTNGGIKVDPFSQKSFIEKTGAMKGTLGDLWDASKEMSQLRAEKTGNGDPVADKYYDKWSKDRRGEIHPEKKKQIAETEAKKNGISLL